VPLAVALDGLVRGCSSAVELVGEPGIGKTRLLRELAARAESRGALVLSGSASELECDLPFSVVVDAHDEYLHSLERERFADMSATAAIGRCARCLSGLGPPNLWCFCWTIFIRPTRHRSSFRERCCAAHQPQAC
jgi:predicted ATPase